MDPTPDMSAQEHKMTDILLGNSVVDPAIITAFLGFSVEHQSYFLMQMSEFESEVAQFTAQALDAVRDVLDGTVGQALPIRDGKVLCAFLKPEETDGELFAKDIAFRTIEVLRNRFGIAVSCGISMENRGTDTFALAYRQAESALARSFVTGAYSINLYSDVNFERDKKDAARLKAFIKNDLAKIDTYDQKQFIAMLEELKNYASSTDLCREYIIGFYFDVIYLAFSLADGEDSEDYLQAQSLLSTMSCAKTLRRLHKTATDIIGVLCSFESVPGNETAVIRHVKDYISDNIATQLSLDDIAAHVYMNSTYLSQLFRRKTGEKLRAYITAERIKKAKIYLSRDKSIHETAVLTGFMSDSYFIQCFKDATGYTPREFVRNHHLDCC